jgi:hypothetical protein
MKIEEFVKLFEASIDDMFAQSSLSKLMPVHHRVFKNKAADMKTFGIDGHTVKWDGQYIYIYRNGKLLHRRSVAKLSQQEALARAQMAIDQLSTIGSLLGSDKSNIVTGVVPAYNYLFKQIKKRVDSKSDVSPRIIAAEVREVAEKFQVDEKQLRDQWIKTRNNNITLSWEERQYTKNPEDAAKFWMLERHYNYRVDPPFRKWIDAQMKFKGPH